MKKNAKVVRRVRVVGQWRLLHDGPNDDLTLALALLCGFYEGNPPLLKFLDTKDEHEARCALARLLRSKEPLDAELREMLATLIDPSLEPLATPRSERIIRIGKRSRGRLSDGVRNRFIALYVLCVLHTKNNGDKTTVEDAVAQVAEEIGWLTEHAVKKIWDKYGKRVDALLREENPAKVR
jgi:hypothetical protein